MSPPLLACAWHAARAMPLPCEPYPYVGAWRLSSVPVLRGSVPRLRGLGTSIGLVQGRVYPTVAERAAANAAPMAHPPPPRCYMEDVVLARMVSRPRHICTETRLAAATSALGLTCPSHICSGAERLHQDWASLLAHICAGTGLTPPTSVPGLGSPLPRLHPDCVLPAPPWLSPRAVALPSG